MLCGRVRAALFGALMQAHVALSLTHLADLTRDHVMKSASLIQNTIPGATADSKAAGQRFHSSIRTRRLALKRHLIEKRIII